MLLDFQFDEARHLYQVPGRYVLSTSDVIDLAGLAEMGQIPLGVLRKASYRGTMLHKAVEQYEMGMEWQENFDQEFMPYLMGWFAFRDQHDIQVLPPCEKQYVYLHEHSDQAIGGTIDIRFLWKGELYIGDIKSTYPLSGKALRQKQLAWRLQLQSYVEMTQLDEQFLNQIQFESIRRVIIHIHPNLKGGYQLFSPETDDALLWDGCVRMAAAKITAGMTPQKRMEEAA